MSTFQLKTKIQGPIAVIGDTHGQTEKLSIVLDRLRQTPVFDRRWVVFIGDFVDRGPDSKAGIEMVLDFIKSHPKTTAVMGNHEFAMCSALGWLPVTETSSWGERWIEHYNSEKTFSSYGAKVGDLKDLSEKIPTTHREFLTDLPWCVEHPQLLFVHAGLDPSRPLSEQSDTVRMNMRGAFLERDFDFGRHVAHGHTPQFNGAPELRPFRSNIDTGVVQTGCLTAARFEPASGPPSAIIATRPDGRTVLTNVRNLS